MPPSTLRISSRSLESHRIAAVVPPRPPSGWSGSRTQRALWHTCLALALGLLPLAGCDRSTAPGSPSHSQASPKDRIERLVQLFTPLAKTVTSDVNDTQFIEGKALLAELTSSGPEIGREALARLRETPEAKRPEEVERALLIVAAHAAPEDSKVLLENLVTQYGTSLALRTEATLLLAEVQPKRALEILEPFVRRAREKQTLPPQEWLVRAWVTACEKSNTDPVPALADVASNLYMEEAARVRAVKELGRHPDNQLAQKTLSAILLESTGDGYLRRMAVQALIKILPRETACSLLARVADKEADTNMLLFLRDALDKFCQH
ncbi:MAG: hypothetical protein IPJ19_10900 [Planctomycetes bacterium]|nr:hypothetical protein [Planctomycetota bacterium]